MTENPAWIPLVVAAPLAGAFLVALMRPLRERVADMTALVVTGAALVLALLGLGGPGVPGPDRYAVGGWEAPYGILLSVDGLSALILVTVNVVALACILFAMDYMKRYTPRWLFHSLFLLMLAGMNGVVVTGDLFNLFVFLEVAAVASYALVAFGTERHALEAAFKYAVMGTLGSMFVLLAIALLYGVTSTLNMADIAARLPANASPGLLAVVAVLFLIGFGLKSAIVPFHAWLPDAHPSAPAPISAMLSGVLIKALGIYALCRVLYNVLGMTAALNEALMFLGVLSMVVGVVLAIGQWDLKRLLAYHSVSQVGYVFLGIGLGTPLGLVGGIFHLVNHSLFKSLLFLNSGAVEYATGTRDLRKMGGLAREMPVTAGTNLVASLSIAGVPPLNGFWSKLLIVLATVEAGRYGYAGLAIMASILTLASFMKVQRYAFLGRPSERRKPVREAPGAMCLAMLLLALLCILGGLLLLPSISAQTLKPAGEVLERGVVLEKDFALYSSRQPGP